MNEAERSGRPAGEAVNAIEPRPVRVGRRDMALVLGLLVVGIVSRALAIPASPSEWDDVLFARALGYFDVTVHSPHPPGFPVFVMLGRAAALLVGEHQAYAAVSLIFGSVLGAALFYFYREVFGDSAVAAAAALIGSFVPNVWVHGGGLRSDGPALTLVIIGLTLAIRGLRSSSALLWASAVTGLSMGVRITVLPTVAPALLVVCLARLRARHWRLVGAALVTLAMAVLAWYVPLVWHTGWYAYRTAVADHARFTFSNDSVIATTEYAVLSLRLSRFFVDIWGTWWIATILYACSIAGTCLLALRRQWRPIGWLAVCFLPIMVFAVLLNTPMAAPLYSLPYVPLFAGLAAFALVTAPRLAARAWNRPALSRGGLILTIAVVGALVAWAYPIVTMLRREESPPVRAMKDLAKTLDQDRDLLLFDPLFLPFKILYLPRLMRDHEGLEADVNLIDPLERERMTYSLTKEPVLGTPGRAYHWASRLGARRLHDLSLGRYFDVYVTGPVGPRPNVFLSGWFAQQQRRDVPWRWMADRSRVALFVGADRMTLHLRAAPPRPANRPTVSLRLDGADLDRFTPIGDTIDRTVTVRPGSGRVWSVLSIDVDTAKEIDSAPARPGLALRCLQLDWSPARGASPTITSSDEFLGPGWSPLARVGRISWRTTARRAVVYLPPLDGDGRLLIAMWMPPGGESTRPIVTVEAAGRVLEQIQPPASLFTRSYRVPPSTRPGPIELTLSTEPADGVGDDRRLGLVVTHLGWMPAKDP
jgi:4-amino-4-deoxy-L-arabinose transferase-like glycosyltransferase